MLDVQYLAQHDMASFSTDNFELWNHKGWQPIPTWIGKEIASGLIICHLKNNVPKLVQMFVSRCHVTGWVGFPRFGWESFANWDVKLMICFGPISIYNPDFWLEVKSKRLDSLDHLKWPEWTASQQNLDSQKISQERALKGAWKIWERGHDFFFVVVDGLPFLVWPNQRVYRFHPLSTDSSTHKMLTSMRLSGWQIWKWFFAYPNSWNLGICFFFCR